MRIAVTGGSGFIGSHVVDHLVDAGHEVDILDLRPPHRTDVRHRPADIGELSELVEALVGTDVVFHLAAVSDVNMVNEHPVDATDLNVLGTAKVWEACRRVGVKRAVLASTVWVYDGAISEPPLDESAHFVLPDCGRHLYTSSKMAAELVVHSYQELYGQEFTILRYGIPYGPRMRPSLVIPRFVRMALGGEPITIDGDGSQYRNYVHVSDLAHAHVLALEKPGANEVFNLEGSEPISIRYLVDCVARSVGRPVDVTFGEPRPGDYRGVAVSAAKAERLLGWTPQIRFEDGLDRYVSWYLAAGSEPVAAAAAAPAAPARAAASAPSAAAARPSRAPSVVEAVAGISLAVVALPALAVGPGASGPDRWLALGGAAVAAATARVVARRPARAALALPSAAVAAVAVWLLSQVSGGPVSIVLGLLLGLAVGHGIAGLGFERWTSTALPAAAAAGALVSVAQFRPDATFWLAAAMGSLAPLVVALTRLRTSELTWSRSWARATVMVTLALLTTSWVGATSAGAAWFGTVVTHGPRTEGRVAITFDGSPNRDQVHGIAGALNSAGASATFFSAAQSLLDAPDVARSLLADGHLLGNFTFSGDADAWLNPRYSELGRAERSLGQNFEVCPTYFRPPNGRHTPLMARVVRNHGMRMVTWDVRVDGGAAQDPARLAQDVLHKVRPGSIVDIELGAGGRSDRGAIVQALPQILVGLRSRGLEPVRLDQLLHASGYLDHC